MPVLKHFDFATTPWKTTETQVLVPTDDGESWRIGKDKLSLILAARSILQNENPMTVRQVYYQLFSRGWVSNSDKSYAQVVGALVDARQRGIIPWEWIEDRVRRPRTVSQYANLAAFLEVVKRAYRRDVWQDQDVYVEVWLEKDALSGIFEDVLREYGITLNVGRGYDGWGSIHDAAERFKARAETHEVHVLYAGDYDPSGLQMEESLRERLAFFGVRPKWRRIGITREQIDEHELPEEPGKHTDSRAQWMIETFGELIQVELDALPNLRDVVREAVEEIIDMEKLETTREEESEEDGRLQEIIEESGE